MKPTSIGLTQSIQRYEARRIWVSGIDSICIAFISTCSEGRERTKESSSLKFSHVFIHIPFVRFVMLFNLRLRSTKYLSLDLFFSSHFSPVSPWIRSFVEASNFISIVWGDDMLHPYLGASTHLFCVAVF